MATLRLFSLSSEEKIIFIFLTSSKFTKKKKREKKKKTAEIRKVKRHKSVTPNQPQLKTFQDDVGF